MLKQLPACRLIQVSESIQTPFHKHAKGTVIAITFCINECYNEGSNSAVIVCAPFCGSPRSIPVARAIGLWRFISRPSTLETVYLSWLAWPRKWRCRLTETEWDLTEPLSRSRSEWIPGWTVTTSVFEQLPAPCWQQGCMLPGELSSYWNEQVLQRGKQL